LAAGTFNSATKAHHRAAVAAHRYYVFSPESCGFFTTAVLALQASSISLSSSLSFAPLSLLVRHADAKGIVKSQEAGQCFAASFYRPTQ